jgi:hypothetical protein
VTTTDPIMRALAQAEAAAEGPAREWLAALRREGESARSPEAERQWFRGVLRFVRECEDAPLLVRLLQLAEGRLAAM